MHHGIKTTVLYTAYKLEVGHLRPDASIGQAVGTGFIIINSHGVPCLVTNRHMIEPARIDPKKYVGYKLDSIRIVGKRDSYENAEDATEDHSFYMNVNKFVFPDDDRVDVTACPVFDLSKNVKNISYHLGYEHLASEDFMESLEVCDFIAVPGFPEWHDTRDHRPIMRLGSIASDPRFKYLVQGEDRGHIIIYEGSSYSGNSGSPVFAIPKGIKPTPEFQVTGHRDFALIGVNAGHYTYSKTSEHASLSYFYGASVVRSLVDSIVL